MSKTTQSVSIMQKMCTNNSKCFYLDDTSNQTYAITSSTTIKQNKCLNSYNLHKMFIYMTQFVRHL